MFISVAPTSDKEIFNHNIAVELLLLGFCSVCKHAVIDCRPSERMNTGSQFDKMSFMFSHQNDFLVASIYKEFDAGN